MSNLSGRRSWVHRVSSFLRALGAAVLLCACGSGGNAGSPPTPPVNGVTSVTVLPATASAASGHTVQFSATVVGGGNAAVQWAVRETAGGTIDAIGLYTAPAAAGTFHVVATSAADPTHYAVATVTATGLAVTVAVAPSSATLLAGATQQFTSTVTGSANTAVVWTVQEGAAGGTVTGNGLYTAPGMAGAFHVIATSAATTARTASATVTVALAPAPTQAPVIALTQRANNIVVTGLVTADIIAASVPDVPGLTAAWVSKSGNDLVILDANGQPFFGPAIGAKVYLVSYSSPGISVSLTAAYFNAEGKGPTSTVTIPLVSEPSFSLDTSSFAVVNGGTIGITSQFFDGTMRIDGVGPLQNGQAFTSAPVTQDKTPFPVVLTDADGYDSPIATPLARLLGPGFLAPGPSMLKTRFQHSAVTLKDDRVLIVGGAGGGVTLQAEIYDPVANTFTGVGSLTDGRLLATATLLADGRVLVVGGAVSSTLVTSAEIFDPATGKFTSTGAPATARIGPASVLLSDGTVLLAAGYAGNSTGTCLSSTEIYTPSAGTFAAGPALHDGRCLPRIAKLPGGKVIVYGGSGTNGYGLPFESLTAGAFVAAGTLTNTRSDLSGALLPSGKLLLAGGRYSNEVDLYDPATAGFTSLAAGDSLADARYDHESVTLADGKVLVVGGTFFNGQGTVIDHPALATELYDPATGRFVPSAPLDAQRKYFTVTSLKNGQALIVGGVDASFATYGAVLYSEKPVIAAGGSDAFNLISWQPSPAASSYTLLRSTGGAFTPVGGPLAGDLSFYADLGVTAGNTYQYELIENTAAAMSAPSDVATATATGVSVTGAITFVNEAATTVLPQHLRDCCTLALLYGSGSAATVVQPIAGNDGKLVFPGVPPGTTYVFRQGDGSAGYPFYGAVTAARSLDLSSTQMGRVDVLPASQYPTRLTLALTGLQPWTTGSDNLSLLSAGANDSYYGFDQLAPPAANATSFTGTWELFNNFANLLNGDTVYITQSVPQMSSNNSPFFSIASVATVAPVISDGGRSSVSAALAAVPTTPLPLLLKGSAFRAYLTAVNPAAVASGSEGFAIRAEPGYATRGDYGNNALLADAFYYGTSYGDVDLGIINVGNPFPASWDLFVQAEQQFTVSFKVPGAIWPLGWTAGLSTQDLLANASTGNLVPKVSPPQTPTINGANAFADQANVGLTPTLAWSAPALGAPTQYTVSICKLDRDSSQKTQATLVIALVTAGTSLQVPPGLLTAGSFYMAQITAQLQEVSTVNTPLQQPISLAQADAVTNKFTP